MADHNICADCGTPKEYMNPQACKFSGGTRFNSNIEKKLYRKNDTIHIE